MDAVFNPAAQGRLGAADVAAMARIAKPAAAIATAGFSHD